MYYKTESMYPALRQSGIIWNMPMHVLHIGCTYYIQDTCTCGEIQCIIFNICITFDTMYYSGGYVYLREQTHLAHHSLTTSDLTANDCGDFALLVQPREVEQAARVSSELRVLRVAVTVPPRREAPEPAGRQSGQTPCMPPAGLRAGACRSLLPRLPLAE